MPVVTRSTTKKTRSLTVYPIPSAQESAEKRVGKTLSRTALKPKPPKRADAKPKTTHRGARKRFRSVANTAANVASCSAEQDQKTENLRIEWEAIVVKHPPCKTLTADELPRSGKNVPHRLYGWPISEDYMLDYARRHRLIFPVDPYYRDRFDGKDEFSFGDLTDDHLADKHLFLALRRSATMRVLFHFGREVHARWMTVDRPISLEWDKILVLWSTDDYEKQYTIYDRPGKWEKVKKFIDDALNECLPEGCERRTSLAWWWSFKNSLSL